MNFIKKIADLFRGLISKKSDSTSEDNKLAKSTDKDDSGDSKLLVFLKKTLAFFYKYTKKFLIFIL